MGKFEKRGTEKVFFCLSLCLCVSVAYFIYYTSSFTNSSFSDKVKMLSRFREIIKSLPIWAVEDIYLISIPLIISEGGAKKLSGISIIESVSSTIKPAFLLCALTTIISLFSSYVL